jgi:hypothetical protein
MAVTAWPVILVDSATGSDSAASGAGPSTALTGTAAATDTGTGATMVVTLDAGTDLTNVFTDGSHAIYLVDATAGHRRFAAINAKAGSGGATPTVTVEQAFTVSLNGKTWAIGGKRAALGSTTTGLLYNNNSAAGDAMPGWTIQLQDGHSETIASGGGPEANGRVWFRRSGDTTSGAITLRGQSGSVTLPKLVFANAGTHGLYSNQTNLVFQNLALENSNATKNEPAIQLDSAPCSVVGVKIGSASNPWSKGVTCGGGRVLVRDCEIGYCKTTAVEVTAANGGLEVLNCYIHDMASGATAAIHVNTAVLSFRAANNVLYNNGLLVAAMRAVADCTLVVQGNTIDSCGSAKDAIQFSAAGVGASGLTVVNNVLSSNGGYGLDFNNATYTDIYLQSLGVTVVGNQTYNNTSNAYKSATSGYSYNNCPWASGDNNLNPTFTNAAGGDFSIGTNLKAKGYPVGGTLAVGTTSSTYSYVDPGAAQRQETSSSSGPVGRNVVVQAPTVY